jgi:hypothetical protein
MLGGIRNKVFLVFSLLFCCLSLAQGMVKTSKEYTDMWQCVHLAHKHYASFIVRVQPTYAGHKTVSLLPALNRCLLDTNKKMISPQAIKGVLVNVSMTFPDPKDRHHLVSRFFKGPMYALGIDGSIDFVEDHRGGHAKANIHLQLVDGVTGNQYIGLVHKAQVKDKVDIVFFDKKLLPSQLKKSWLRLKKSMAFDTSL